MARSTKSYEERMLQLEKKEQESLEKAKQYAAQKRELKKRQKDVETKKEEKEQAELCEKTRCCVWAEQYYGSCLFSSLSGA